MANLLIMLCCGFLELNDSNKLYASVVPYVSHDDFYASRNEEAISDDISFGENEDISVDVVKVDDSSNEEVVVNESSKLLDNLSEEADDITEEIVEDDSSIGQEETNVIDELSITEDEENTTEDENILVEYSRVVEEEITDDKVGYYSPNGTYLGENNIKVVDVSSYQKDVNWDIFASESDCYGVILRLGYYETLDKKFERNISELKRLNIPYGIYLYSYSVNKEDAVIEAEFTKNMIEKYEIEPTLGIYYDIESWNRNVPRTFMNE